MDDAQLDIVVNLQQYISASSSMTFCILLPKPVFRNAYNHSKL